MGKLSYILILLILYEVLLQENVALSDQDIESSSVLHIRQKRMYEFGHPIDQRMYHPRHPWSAIALGRHAENLRAANMNNPTLVEFLEDDYDSRYGERNGYAVHPYLIIVPASFIERLNPHNHEQYRFKSQGSQHTPPFSGEHHIVGSPIINEPLHISVIEVDKPVWLINKVANGLSVHAGFTDEAIVWAKDEIHKIILHRLGDPLSPKYE